MANFTYKKTLTTQMKVVGTLDTDMMTIEVDGENKKISTLLSDFEGECIEITVKTKAEQELDEPTVSDDE